MYRSAKRFSQHALHSFVQLLADMRDVSRHPYSEASFQKDGLDGNPSYVERATVNCLWLWRKGLLRAKQYTDDMELPHGCILLDKPETYVFQSSSRSSLKDKRTQKTYITFQNVL